MWPNPQFSADLVKFTEEMPNGKLRFLCSETILADKKVFGLNSKCMLIGILSAVVFVKQIARN